MSETGRKPRHIGDPARATQPEAADEPRPRVLISRCLLGHAVRYDGRDKHLAALDPLIGRWRVLPLCPELEAGLGVPRPPMDLVGPRETARPVERASGRDLTAEMAPVLARVRSMPPPDGAVLKARSPSCGLGSAARYDHIDDPAPAERVDGVFAAALRRLDPPPALIDEPTLAADPAPFAAAVALRAGLRAARDPEALDRLWTDWQAGPHGPALRAAGLDREALGRLSGDRVTLVRHIDRAVGLETCPPGDHLYYGSRLARRTPDAEADAADHKTPGSEEGHLP